MKYADKEVWLTTKKELQRESFSWHYLAIHNAFGLVKEGGVYFRICAGKLSYNILNPSL